MATLILKIVVPNVTWATVKTVKDAIDAILAAFPNVTINVEVTQ